MRVKYTGKAEGLILVRKNLTKAYDFTSGFCEIAKADEEYFNSHPLYTEVKAKKLAVKKKVVKKKEA